MNSNEFVFPDPALVPDEHIAMTLTQLAAFQSALAARLILARSKEEFPQTMPQEEELLTAEQAAVLLSVSVDWMYRHACGLPFTKRLSRKALRFSKAGLVRWRAGRRA
jgi:hypothetical protein